MKSFTIIAFCALGCLANAVPLELSHQGRIAERGVNFDGTGHFKFVIHDGGRDPNKQATARASVALGGVRSVTVLASGGGYLTRPAISFVGGGGTGARAIATIDGGIVTAITVTNQGTRYTSAPTVVIAPPTSPPVFETLWSHDGSSTDGGEPASGLGLPVTKGLYSVRLGNTDISGMTQDLKASDLAGHDQAGLRIWFSNTGKPDSFQLLTPDQPISSTAFAIRAAVAESVEDGAIGAAQLAAGSITGSKIAAGSIDNSHIAAPGSEKVLISDGNGGSTWMTIDEFLLAKNYTPSLPGIIENLATIEIDGVMVDTVQIINGPGMRIEDLGGSPSESGLNTEFPIVFDYLGSFQSDLQDWLDNPVPRSFAIIVKDSTDVERFRWIAQAFQLSDIAIGGGNNGKNRYTLTHTLSPNSALAIDRSPSASLSNVDRKPGDTLVEIEGVTFNVWPVVTNDPVAKTLTMTFDFNEGGGIWDWAEDIAEAGTFARGRKSLSLIYQNNRGTEIGRNNFYECFPIQYQHFTGFDLHTKGQERIIISYDFAENANAGGPLYVPPVIEYHPGTPLMEMPYDLAENKLTWEIDGVLTNQTTLSSEVPVLISGPGWEIERIPGFGPFGRPNDQSGNNKEFPIVLEVGGIDLTRLSDWREDYMLDLPLDASTKNIVLILPDSTSTETLRWNLLEMIPYEISALPSGRSRVTLYSNLPPDRGVLHELDQSSDWGSALQNNPATDTQVEIEGIGTLFAASEIDDTERTITLDFDFGEGGFLWDWAKAVAIQGTSTFGKTTIASNGFNYFGCFPIAIQHYSGFEQDIKGKAKIVISYDYLEAQ